MLNKNDHVPLKTQLEDLIRQHIESGNWTPDQQIPSENELSRDCGVSRMTVRGVIVKLALEGLLYTVPGKGTFVSQPKIISKPLAQMGIRGQLEEKGYELDTRLVSVKIVNADWYIAQKLSLEPKAPVWEIKRVRYIKDEPLSMHISYIPVQECPDLSEKDFATRQLCHIIEDDYKLPIISIDETIEIKKADEEECQFLNIPYLEPLLLVKELVYTNGDKPIELASVLFKGNKIKLQLSKPV